MAAIKLHFLGILRNIFPRDYRLIINLKIAYNSINNIFSTLFHKLGLEMVDVFMLKYVKNMGDIAKGRVLAGFNTAILPI